mmetsp:Transcript_43218/g.69291  ORF Transcript_43218/g.69291 Transcript_43218/m.69291 type:complete len:807 (-) Transcript_43218:3595-6015(-)
MEVARHAKEKRRKSSNRRVRFDSKCLPDQKDDKANTRKTSFIAKDGPLGSDPERLRAQFVWARKQGEMELMSRVVEKLKEDDNLDQVLPQSDLDESLMFVMLSGNVKMAQLLFRVGATIVGADEIHDEMKGSPGSCNCEHHPGALLVTLSRQGSHRMVEFALDEGIPVNSSVCDGETQRMWWGVGITFQGVQAVRTPVLKSTHAKSTALTAACVNNDMRMVELLVRNGAKLDLDNWAAIAEATMVQDSHHQVLKYLLNRMSSLPEFPADKRILHAFQDACAVALRTAAARGDGETVKWIVDRMDQAQDWNRVGGKGFGSSGAKRETTVFESSRAKTASGSDDDPEPRKNGSCLNQNSMQEYGERRKSLLLKPHILNVNGSQGSSRTKMPRHIEREDMVRYAMEKAVDSLIQNGLDEGNIHIATIVRGLEGLGQIEKFRVGNSSILQSRVHELYTLFIKILQENNGKAQEHAITLLLHCGVEQFLGLRVDESDHDGALGASSARSSLELSEEKIEEDGPSPKGNSKGDGKSKNLWGRIKTKLAKVGHKQLVRSPSKRRMQLATLEEQVKAMTVAAQGGHMIVLKHLLKCSGRNVNMFVANLLSVAAKYNQLDILDLLLEYNPENDPRGTILERGDLEEAVSVALRSGSIDFVEQLVAYGAKVSSSNLCAALKKAVSDADFTEESIEFIAHLVEENEVTFEQDEMESIMDSATMCSSPNLYSLASVLDFDKSYRKAVRPKHLMNVVEYSSANASNPDWQELTLILVKCMEDDPNFDDAIHEAHQLAKSANVVHPGVLHVMQEVDINDN